MFSKLNFLGVANATSAKMTGAVKKFTAFTAMALVAFGLTACGSSSSEEKETRAVPSDWGIAKEDGDLAVPKSYVRENKSVTPPFIATIVTKEERDGRDGFVIFADEQSQKDIIDVKVNNGECKADYRQGRGMGPMIVMEMGFCDIKQIELTTKAGKVTYKF